MFSPPSLQREYKLCSEKDPALDLPEVPELDLEKATPEEVELAKTIAEERATKIRVAREQGKWDSILKDGARPTYFVVRNIAGVALTWLHAEIARRDLTMDQAYELAFRLGVRNVENFGAHKLEFEQVDGHKLMKLGSLQRFYEIGQATDPLLGTRIVFEIGALILTRAIEGVPPLS